MRKKIMILGAGEMQVPIIEKCTSLGIATVVLDGNADAPGLKICTDPHVISSHDFEQALKMAESHHIDGILTTSDYPVRIVAKVAEQLGLPALSVRAAELCTDKYLQRSRCVDAGIAAPAYQLFSERDQVIAISKDFDFPFIVKPIDSSASRGVSLVTCEEELGAAILEARANSKQGNLLIEEFVGGDEYSLEGLVQYKKLHLIAITEKAVNTSALHHFFVEKRHIIPAYLSEDRVNEIRLFAEKVVNSFELDHCAIHLEFKLSEKGITLIECAARLGGDYITSDLVPLATGVDMNEAIIQLALGEPIDVTQKNNNIAGIQFLDNENYHVLKKYIQQNTDKLVRSDIREYKNRPAKNSLERLGYFIVVSSSREELINKLNGI